MAINSTTMMMMMKDHEDNVSVNKIRTNKNKIYIHTHREKHRMLQKRIFFNLSVI